MNITKRGEIGKSKMQGECRKCGCQFECLQEEANDYLNDKPLIDCPQCGHRCEIFPSNEA